MISILSKLLIAQEIDLGMKYDHACKKAIQQIAQRTSESTYTMYKLYILNYNIRLIPAVLYYDYLKLNRNFMCSLHEIK